MSSYPTYEEWKLPRPDSSSIAVCSVLILPMRNGNRPSSMIFKVLARTCSYPTYEEWKLEKTEGRNIVPQGSYPTYEEWKLHKCI